MSRESAAERDVVTELISSIARQTKLSITRLRALETDLRRIYGGRVHYISRGGEAARLMLWERNECIRAEARAGVDAGDTARRYGLSRRRVRQICAGDAIDP